MQNLTRQVKFRTLKDSAVLLTQRTLFLTIVFFLAATANAWADEFTNSFALDVGEKNYHISVTGNNQHVDLSGAYDTSLHATWMLRLYDPSFDGPGFMGGLGLAYGHYEATDLSLNVFECRGDFGPAFEPVSWLRVGMLFFGGIGYHELHLTKAVYATTTVSGIGNLGFSYGANAELTIKILPRLHLSGQAGFRGLYVSDGTFQNDQLVRGVESSTIGLLLGASIDFAF